MTRKIRTGSICPRCKERPLHGFGSYCRPCFAAYARERNAEIRAGRPSRLPRTLRAEPVSGPLPTPCLNYQGPTNPKGYCNISFRNRKTYAHRVAWILANGAIPDGLMVCHRCDNPRCVNVEHLFLGTGFDNMRDCQRKGRTSRGTRHYMAQLDERGVFEARRLLAAGLSPTEIGRRLGVSKAAIQGIKSGRTWKWLREPAQDAEAA